MTADDVNPGWTFADVAPGVRNVLVDGRCVGQVRKAGYRHDAFSTEGELIRSGLRSENAAVSRLIWRQALLDIETIEGGAPGKQPTA